MRPLDSDIDSNSILVYPPAIFHGVAPSPLSISRPVNKSLLAEKIELPNFSNINESRSAYTSVLNPPTEGERRGENRRNALVSSPAFSLRTGHLSVPEKGPTQVTPTVQRSANLPSPGHAQNFASFSLKKFNSFGFCVPVSLMPVLKESAGPPQIATTPKVKDVRKKRKYTCCNCKNSHCLKLYCECYRSRGACSSHCRCKDCYNTVKMQKFRQGLHPDEQPQEPPIKIAHKRLKPTGTRTKAQSSCRCKKSYCLKKYCECFSSGTPCSKDCACQGCQNVSQ